MRSANLLFVLGAAASLAACAAHGESDDVTTSPSPWAPRGGEAPRLSSPSGAAVVDVGSPPTVGSPDPEAQLDTGRVRGTHRGQSRAFLGLPYAAPPTGANRWRPPLPAARWEGLRDAKELGALCPQINPLSGAYDPRSNEDCLTLNVWAPDPLPSKPAAVLVWLHGGAYVFGGGAEELYDGQKLVERTGVVVVTINYRLGALGFLAHPALSTEDPAWRSSGNYGLADQRAALAWVSRNITAFGGDPARVTLFGESAGGISTCLHTLHRETSTLFQRAIVQSGPCVSPLSPRMVAEAQGVEIAVAAGCGVGPDALACLRSKSPEELLALHRSEAPPPPGGVFYQGGSDYSFRPIVDGEVIRAQPRELLLEPRPRKTPVLLGSNADEGTVFVKGLFGGAPVQSDEEYRAALARTFGPAVTMVTRRYPSASYASPSDALAAVTGDAFFTCPTRRTARTFARAGFPTYRYAFEAELEAVPMPGLGVFHSSEIPFVFGNEYALGRVPAAGRDLSQSMMGYWSRFAATGDPNGQGAVPWPRYDGRSDRSLVLAPTITTTADLAGDRCDFWDRLLP